MSDNSFNFNFSMFLIAESVIVLDPTSSFYLISEISLLWAPFTFANGWCSHFNSTLTTSWSNFSLLVIKQN